MYNDISTANMSSTHGDGVSVGLKSPPEIFLLSERQKCSQSRAQETVVPESKC